MKVLQGTDDVAQVPINLAASIELKESAPLFCILLRQGVFRRWLYPVIFDVPLWAFFKQCQEIDFIFAGAATNSQMFERIHQPGYGFVSLKHAANTPFQ